ncbi:aromatic ring-hydroxylating dioxygenase subunit alpha, partial [Pelomonas sp. KK5]|uniref:aromatic ring-hydroxylating oxygenase subunit alpha n=1 Tax=Pelomonas sp. KK5 TaxID=1855730 RepID=UPI00097BE41C
VYTDPAHFDRERAALLRRVPLPLTASGSLARNSVFASDDFGLPILLTRDDAGAVHAFLNACTHRGAKLVDPGETRCTRRVSCPFHAWTFSLDGRLVGVPRAETFPTLDKSTHGLRRLPVCEAGGIIWVGLDSKAPPDFSEVQGQLARDFEAFGIPAMHVYGRRTFDLAANWKLLIETFLETYHVAPLHAKTVAPMFAPVPTLMSHFGPHTRQTVGRSHFTREMLDVQVDQLHKQVTHAYHLFPTAMLVTSPHHMNFITVMPRAVDRSIVVCHMLTRDLPETEEQRQRYERTLKFNFEDVFGAEDFQAAQRVQQGLASGALDEVRFGGLEEALATFHANIERVMQP